MADGTQRATFGEVQYFFRAQISTEVTKALALISVYDPPDADLLQESSHALWVTKYRGNMALKVIDIKTIKTCVAMVPFTKPADGHFFVCEKMGLEVGYYGGEYEDPNDSDDPDV